MAKIRIARAGEEFGPYSLEQIRQYLESGQIREDDWAWIEGQSDWVPLSQLLQSRLLQSRLPPSPPLLPAPEPIEGFELEVAGAPSETSSESGASSEPASSEPEVLASLSEPEALSPLSEAEVPASQDGADLGATPFADAGAPSWFHRTPEGTLTELGAGELLEGLSRGELARKGWVWTPGLLSWAPARNARDLIEALGVGRQPPLLPPVRSDADPLVEMKQAASFPFRNFREVKKAWHLILVQFIPGVASIVNRGWRLEILRRPVDDPFPKLGELPRLALSGLVLWFMYSLYLLPELLYLFFDKFGWLFDFLGVCQYIFSVITNANPASGLGAFLSDVGVGFIFESGFMIFFPIASWPFYRVAMLRYAKSRDLSVFFDLKNNWKIAKGSYPLIMHTYAQNKLLWLCAFTVGGLVSLTGVGVLLVPAVIRPLRLFTSGVLFRGLLTKLEARGFLDASGAPAMIEAETSKAVGRPAESEARRWFVATRGREVEEASPERLASLWASAGDASSAEESPELFWTAGMWRWESSPEALRFARQLQSSPPAALPEEASSPSIRERIRNLPSMVWKEFRPGEIWRDLKALVFDVEGGDTKGLWKSRLSWFLVLQYVPVIASLVNRGWRIDLMRSAATEGLPSRRNLGRHLAEGLLLWGIYLIYLLPFFVLLVLTDFKWIEQVIGLLWWFAQVFVGSTPGQSLGQVLGGGILRFFFETLLNIAYPIASWPFYRGAMIRYALEDNLRVFWELKKNYRFSKLNFDTLTGIYLAQKTLWGIYTLVSMILIATGIGAFLVPGILSPLRLLVSGVVYLRGMRKAPSMRGFFPE